MWIRRGAHAISLTAIVRIYVAEKSLWLKTIDGGDTEFVFDTVEAAEKAFKGIMNVIMTGAKVLDVRYDGTVVL
jgi:hypothetical protein